MTSPGGTGKVCVICGEDCSNKPRTKDAKGRYYCTPCFDAAKLRAQKKSSGTVPRPQPKPSPRALDSDGPSMLEKLLDQAPQGAAASAASACPSCHSFVADGTVICTSCGYNTQTGQRLSVKTVKAPRESSFELSGMLGLVLGPYGVALIIGALMAVLFAVAQGDETKVFAYLALDGLFALAIGVVTLIFAFRESAGTGFLTLCVPCYAVYFIYGVSDNSYLRILFPLSILMRIGGFALAQSIGMNLSDMPGARH